LAEDDTELFRRAMSDAKPLNSDKRAPLPDRKTKPRRRISRDDIRHESEPAFQQSSGPDFSVDDEIDDSMRFNRPSVSHRTMRKLSRGGYRVEAELDLHGMTVAEAELRLTEFIGRWLAEGRECVQVVHGKGLGSGTRGPVLKRGVNRWLRQWDNVLAFVPSRQADGGSGAVYVLLRRI
jgi:DNA-nicking Smr family endonuclease